MLLKRAMLAQLRNPTDTTSRLFLSTWVGCLAGAHQCTALIALSATACPYNSLKFKNTFMPFPWEMRCPRAGGLHVPRTSLHGF